MVEVAVMYPACFQRLPPASGSSRDTVHSCKHRRIPQPLACSRATFVTNVRCESNLTLLNSWLAPVPDKASMAREVVQ